MKVLVINCGSSSLKYQLIDMDGEKVLCKGLCVEAGTFFFGMRLIGDASRRTFGSRSQK